MRLGAPRAGRQEVGAEAGRRQVLQAGEEQGSPGRRCGTGITGAGTSRTGLAGGGGSMLGRGWERGWRVPLNRGTQSLSLGGEGTPPASPLGGEGWGYPEIWHLI